MSVLTTVAPPLTAAAVRALGATLRLRSEGLEPLEALWAARRPVIFSVWHARILMVPWLNARLVRTRSQEPPSSPVQRGRDAQVWQRCCQGAPRLSASPSACLRVKRVPRGGL